MKDNKPTKIYHNPKCSTSRNALKILCDHDIDPEIVLYLQNPPDFETLEALTQKIEGGARTIIRRKEDLYAVLNMSDLKMSDTKILELLVAHPALIERPIIDAGDKAVLCRPLEAIFTLLPEGVTEIVKEDGKILTRGA